MTSFLLTITCRFTITLNWHINFGLGVVSDGGLQIARIPDPPGTDAITVTGVSSNEGLNWNTPWDQYEDAIRNGVNDFFQSKLSNAENDLVYGLANQNKLFLPAGGTFLMEGAEFNARGDLLAFLHYDGYVESSPLIYTLQVNTRDSAPPPGKTKEPPAYLGELPHRKGRNPLRAAPPRQKPIDIPAGRIYPKNPVDPKAV